MIYPMGCLQRVETRRYKTNPRLRLSIPQHCVIFWNLKAAGPVLFYNTGF